MMMTEEQKRIHDIPLWWEDEEKRQQSIERWRKSPLSPKEMVEQANRLERSLTSITRGSKPF